MNGFLEKNKDLKATYKNNINVGEVQVITTGACNYVNQIIQTFQLNKAANPLIATGKTAAVKYSAVKSKAQALTVSNVLTVSKVRGAEPHMKSTGNAKIIIHKATGKVTVKKGLYKVIVRVTAFGNSNYKALYETATVTIKV